MASDLNEVKIDGRLVEDPRIRELASGARVATLRVANDRYFKGKDSSDWKEKTGFFEVEAWNAAADAVAKLSRGQAVHIEGALGQQQWTDSAGAPRYRVVIEATKIEARELKRERTAEARKDRQEAGVEL